MMSQAIAGALEIYGMSLDILAQKAPSAAIFGVAVDDSGSFGTISAGTGFTRRATLNNMDMATEDMVQAATGTVAGTFTFSLGDVYLAQMATFMPATGTGASPTMSSVSCNPASLLSGAIEG